MASFVGTVAWAQEPAPAGSRAKVIEQARGALVQVELFLKHSSEDEIEGTPGGGDTGEGQTLDRQQEVVARFKQTVHLMGALLGPRAVLVPDMGIDPRRIDRWDVTDASGRRIAARRTALLLDTPGLILEPNDPGEIWQAPTFADAAVDPGSTLVLVTPTRSHLQWVLNPGAAPPRTAWSTGGDSDRPTKTFWPVAQPSNTASGTENSPGGEPPARSVTLVFTTAGQLLGAATADRLYADQPVPPWRAADLRAAGRITWDEWEKTQERTRQQLGNVMYPIRIEYRRPKGGAQALPESELLGWALSDRTLMVPTSIHRQIAARIDRVSVQVRGRDVAGRLIGQCKEFDAFLIGLAEGVDSLPAHSDLSQSPALPQYHLHAAVTPGRRYGQNDLRTNYTRPVGHEFGYGNRVSPNLEPPPPIGSVVLDLEGRPVGLFLRQRRPLEELELYERLTRLERRQFTAQGIQGLQEASSVEFFPSSALAGMLKNSDSALDPHVVQRSEADQDRRVWLGIEFNPLTRELAESLGCRKESKDGAVGLMISQVYSDSPAEEADLRTGDVLLWLEAPERGHPVLLTPPRLGGGFAGGDNAFAGQGSNRAPWPSRGNFLTGLLATIGENTSIMIKYWRDGGVHELATAIRQAPPDQDSAAQFKDEGLGITVKEVTYEVRAALRLKPNDPGVIVAKVESGSPASRARINPFELVQAADGEPIASPAQFEEIVKKAQDDKSDQIRLTIVDRGRSRFADLKLSQ